jgi:hypothetical protein
VYALIFSALLLFVKPQVNYLIDYMVTKSSHILVHIVLGRLGLMGKVLILWSIWGRTSYYYPRMYVNLKSTTSVLIFS